MNICIFGDSVTWGAWLPERVAWVDLLRTDLEQRYGRRYSVYNLGIDGDTSRDLLSRFDSEARARRPGLIIIAIGVNDSYYISSPDQPLVSLTEFEANVSSLISQAKALNSQVMLVGLVKGDDSITVPFPGSTTGKCYTKAQVRLYDQRLQQLAKEQQLPFVQVYEQLTDADFVDGLHPNAAGQRKIYEQVRQSLESVLC